MSTNSLSEKIFVRATTDYAYRHNGEKIFMEKDEVFLLIREANDNWSQVIRKEFPKPFFAPRKLLEYVELSKEEMKKTVKQHKLDNFNFTSDKVNIKDNKKSKPHTELPVDFNVSKLPSKNDKQHGNNVQNSYVDIGSSYSKEPNSNVMYASKNPSGNSYIAKIDTNQNIKDNFTHTPKHNRVSSFKSHSPSPRLKPRISEPKIIPIDFDSPSSPTTLSPNSPDSLSSDTSKSSLLDSSLCSSESIQFPVKSTVLPLKSASHEGLILEDRCSSSLEIRATKAASNEELDSQIKDNSIFPSNQLNYRSRSSSVDFKQLQKELLFDKGHVNKDAHLRRRSWVIDKPKLFEPKLLKSLRSSDESDVAKILDPPKLPPKKNKNKRLGNFSSSIDDLSRISIHNEQKLPDPRMIKSSSVMHMSNVKRLSQGYEHAITKQVKNNSIDRKEPPIPLPRKDIPFIHHVNSGLSDQTQSSPNSRINESTSSIDSSNNTLDSNGQSSLSEDKENSYYSLQHSVSTDSIAKHFSTPPSPKGKPTRRLHDEWFEYFDNSSQRQFFFNHKTKEKRWKPPRKGIQNIAIPEVPADHVSELSPRTRGLNYQTSRIINQNQMSRISLISNSHLQTSKSCSNVPLNYNTLPFDSNQSSSTNSDPSSSSNSSSNTLPGKTINNVQSKASIIEDSISSIINNSPLLKPKHSKSSSSVKLNKSSMFQPSSSGSKQNNEFLFDFQKPRLTPHKSGSFSGLPKVPPSSAKPQLTDDSVDLSSQDLVLSPLKKYMEHFQIPRGYLRKIDPTTNEDYFCNLQSGEKWYISTTDTGDVYFYAGDGSQKSQWSLPPVEYQSQESLVSPADSVEKTSSLEHHLPSISDDITELSQHAVFEGMMHRTNYMKGGKKMRKNWTQFYVRYVLRNFSSGSAGLLLFSKNKDDKKPEVFDLYPPCLMEHATDKKTSRCHVISLKNGHDLEVLLQPPDSDLGSWTKHLSNHKDMKVTSPAPEERKNKKQSAEKVTVKREESLDPLKSDQITIKHRLKNLIKRRPPQDVLIKKGIYKTEPVIGSTLKILYERDNTLTPIFVLRCIGNIQRKVENLQTDGIYRVSGNGAQIQKIRYQVAQRNYNIIDEEKDVHNVTGALKLFFRELKEPLIPYSFYQEFIQASGADYYHKDQRSDELAKAVQKLPKENKETLYVLLQHLLVVNEHEKDNRMSILNLAIVFGQCILWPEISIHNDIMTDVMLHNRVVEGLLTHFKKIPFR